LKQFYSSRFAAAVLAAAIAAGPMAAAQAFAAEGTVQIENATKGTYKIYQLFTGSFANGKMGDIAVNSSYKDALVTALQKVDSTFVLDASKSADAQASDIAAAVAGLDEVSLQALANDLAPSMTGTPYASADSSVGIVDFGSVPEGYYIVISDAGNAVKTSAILLPVTSAGQNVELKATLPSVLKTADRTDSGITAGAVNAPTYTVTGSVASNIADYSIYAYSFTDTLPAGLTTTAEEVKADWNVSILADGTDVTNAFSVSVSADGGTITWSCADLKKAASITANTNVVLTYTPVYDDDDIAALYGSKSTAPMVNTVMLTYSNNPYTGSEGSTDSTPSDTEQVESFNLVINKKTTSGISLAGAEFTLTCNGTEEGKKITDGSGTGVFEFTGLERGKTYTITETTVPAGYKRIDPITFTINSETAADGTVTNTFAEVTDPSSAATFETSGNRTGTVNIVNLEGVTMPFTGEAGMIGGMVVGGLILTISAAAVFRRKDKE
jgi:fimbrial isopeptide formation D2 family protein